MPTTTVNGATLYWETLGERGDPLVLVHGSWVDLRQWKEAADLLAARFRVLTFDRRGHGKSGRAPGERGVIEEDVLDVAALVEELEFAPAHIAGNSFGSSIVLRLAYGHPNLFRTVIVHEPPLIGILSDDPDAQPVLADVQAGISSVAELIRAGRNADAAKRFVDTLALGPGGWAGLPQDIRESFVADAYTFIEEIQQPEAFAIDLAPLQALQCPVLLTAGAQSPAFLGAIVARITAALPRAKRHTFEEAGHVPHLTHPQAYAEVLSGFIEASGDAQ